MGEFDLIKRYFTPARYAPDVLLGVGDDAAVLSVPPGHKLVAAVDTLVAGIHFPADTSAADIAYRALAVNLSDMAAMGATPRWFTLSLCLPQINEVWLAEFSRSLQELAARFDVQLVGGDTVKGPLNISIQIMGVVSDTVWLGRAGAQPGDRVFISGVPGEAAGGLRLLLQPLSPASQGASAQHREHLLRRFYRPEPRIELGKAIRNLASAAMDVSDGLLTDLGKLCAASHCGAHLQLDSLPHSAALQAVFGAVVAESLALQGGDDYELLFTVAPGQLSRLEAAIAMTGVVCTPIGRIGEGGTVNCYRQELLVEVESAGFDHFAGSSGQVC